MSNGKDKLMDAFDMLSEREKKVLIMLDGLDGTPAHRF